MAKMQRSTTYGGGMVLVTCPCGEDDVISEGDSDIECTYCRPCLWCDVPTQNTVCANCRADAARQFLPENLGATDAKLKAMQREGWEVDAAVMEQDYEPFTKSFSPGDPYENLEEAAHAHRSV